MGAAAGPECRAEFLVLNEHAGHLIGKGGSIIKQPVLFRRLQAIAKRKNQGVLEDMFRHRDQNYCHLNAYE